MAPCPRCGTPNAPGVPLCAACGAQLVSAPKDLVSTLVAGSNVAPTQPDFPALGAAAPAPVPATWPDAPVLEQPAPPAAVPAPAAAQPAPPAAQPVAPQPSPAKRTMMGIAPVSLPEPPAPLAPVGVKRTMMGLAPPTVPQASSPGPSQGAHQPVSKTMVGIAPAPQQQPPPPSAAPGSAALPSQLKTKMGLAHPGIVPLHPGVAKPVGPAHPASQRELPPPSASAELREEDLAVLPGRPKSAGSASGLLVILVLSGAVFLLAVAIGIAIWWKSGPDLEASAAFDESGKETLVIGCPEPCDYVGVRVGSSSAKFESGKAELALEQPLGVGENEITLELEQADGDRRSVDLTVPVAYRLKTDFAGLSGDPPRVSVHVEAEPETAVVVDGKPVTLDEQGKGTHSIDVARELTGPAARVIPLEKKVPYGVTRPKAEPERGELALRIGIVPLEVDAPGESIVIDSANFTLAGRTQTGGSVSVGGRPITVDPSGRFAQLMNVSSVGETTIVVRASAADRAPRLFPIRVRRVQSLAAEAARFGARATRAYSAIAADIGGKRGWAVAFEGDVVEARTENHTSILLLDVWSGCSRAPCLARLVHGAKTPFKKGDAITAYGHVSAAVDGPRSGVKIPELRVDFMLPTRGARR